MKYIIMADGKGTRWNNSENIPKHFLKFDGETLLERTVRLLRQNDSNADVIITSHDPRYEVPGARRYEPQNNVLELDRFTVELIEDNVCFLYGDTYYSDSAIQTILEKSSEDVSFFGNEKSIVAVKVKSAEVFCYHMERVRALYLSGELSDCKGWQVYQSYAGLPFGEKQMGEHYVYIKDETKDFNTPEDLENL